MLESLRVKFVDWIQTLLNPHIGRRHPIHMLLTNMGMKPIARRRRRIYNVSHQGGRLIGVYEMLLPGDIFKTCLRICVYERKSLSQARFGDVMYCAAYIFFHADETDQFKLGSMYQTEYMTFASLAKFTREAKTNSYARAEVYRILTNSKDQTKSPLKTS